MAQLHNLTHFGFLQVSDGGRTNKTLTRTPSIGTRMINFAGYIREIDFSPAFRQIHRDPGKGNSASFRNIV